MSLLPDFTSSGVLPSGDYALTFAELRQSLLVLGHAGNPHWDLNWRLELVNGCEILVRQLWAVGISAIFLDGSFVEDKAHPGDIDGYFECDLQTLSRVVTQLNLLDPYKVWTWSSSSRQLDPASGKRQLPMWFRYHTELFPHLGQSSGIPGPQGFEQTFPDAFRHTRSGTPKGIIRPVPEGIAAPFTPGGTRDSH